jgi:hypothetical protein
MKRHVKFRDGSSITIESVSPDDAANVARFKLELMGRDAPLITDIIALDEELDKKEGSKE